MNENLGFHEVWWIYSPVNNKEWAGLRIAHFRKTSNGIDLLVNITGEIDQKRIGLRIWEEIQRSEHWYKVEQIPIPSVVEIMKAAIDQGVIDKPTTWD
jgi:hypothetical protein